MSFSLKTAEFKKSAYYFPDPVKSLILGLPEELPTEDFLISYGMLEKLLRMRKTSSKAGLSFPLSGGEVRDNRY